MCSGIVGTATSVTDPIGKYGGEIFVVPMRISTFPASDGHLGGAFPVEFAFG